MGQLVSVITPHRPGERHDWIFDRCIDSVQTQTYSPIEHVIVSDGPDPVLERLIGHRFPAPVPGQVRVVYHQMRPNPDPRWGTRARLAGIELSMGEYIAYLDDDDAYRPRHCELLAAALDAHPEAGFAYAKMATHGMVTESPGGTIVGSGELGPCAIGTPMMMHRRGLLELATWGPPDPMEDWRLVDRWLLRDVTAQFVNETTVDAWPSAYR
jgi:glycosyltransferase involved in cell wall biosynthesis